VTTMATVVCCLLDVPERRLVYSSAGHLAPILVDQAGARLLPAPQGPPVGVRFEGRYEEIAVTFAPPATLVVYSDGLVERRGHALDSDMERLRSMVEANAEASPDDLCDVLLDLLLDVDVPDDDVALLAVRIDAPGPTPSGSPS
jgi:serine phosphatase RsbU (regulator of sigma subunit)